MNAVERLLGADTADLGAIGRAASGGSPRVGLFDELEKAYPKVWILFIQMLEPGQIMLANSEVVSLWGELRDEIRIRSGFLEDWKSGALVCGDMWQAVVLPPLSLPYDRSHVILGK